MPNEYDAMDKVKAMTPEQRAALPKIVNTNGEDYASCPRCRHYHAMMPAFVYITTEVGTGPFRFNYCRDCGALGRVLPQEKN